MIRAAPLGSDQVASITTRTALSSSWSFATGMETRHLRVRTDAELWADDYDTILALSVPDLTKRNERRFAALAASRHDAEINI